MMCVNFLKTNVVSIDACVNRVIERALHQNAEILTKGRQTLDCFTPQSVTASVAYKRMHDFYNENTNCGTLSCLEWIRCFFVCLDLTKMSHLEIIENRVTKNIYDARTKQRIPKETCYKRLIKTTKEGADVRRILMNFVRSFASYIKHKERRKLNRRAIASANVILRMFLYIIEEFHLDLGKHIEGSTISIGGEEKKAKIINNLSKVVLSNQSKIIEVQGTEDATKWNECLSPAAFAMMHKTFFDKKVRSELGLPAPFENALLFMEIALSGHFIMSIKRILMGPGPMANNESFYNRLSWRDDDISRFNINTQEWLLLRAKPLLDEDGYMNASPGMLMGMLNAGFTTTLGLLATGYGLNSSCQQIRTLRCSDYSTTIYAANSLDNLQSGIEINRRALACIGINLSREKTFFYTKYYSEYTSWYQDQGFVSQFGVETSSIRPQGKNPPDDFYAVAKATATGLSTLTLNHIGATVRLILGIQEVRRIWRISKQPTKREGISPRVLLLSDGGLNLWDSCNCHLEELTLRERYASEESEKQYLLKVCNPNNPFCSKPTEEVSYSKDAGRLITTEVETPRTVFHCVKRSNRTVNNSVKKTMFDQEKINSETAKIVKAVIPTTMVKYPTDATMISRQLIAALSIYRSRVSLSEDEERQFKLALDSLKHDKEVEQMDGEDFGSHLESWE